MNRRDKKRKGLSPAVAVLLLVVCGGGAWWSLSGSLSGPAADGGDAIATGDGDFDAEPEATEEGEGEANKPGRDLLAEFGSYERGKPVRMAFASLLDIAIQAAPAVETNASPGARWIGADPPTMQVGVVMVGESVRRAVVNGVVVGVGDNVGRSTVVGIERDAIHVVWGSRRLTYDLDNEYPREFRSEVQRRGAAQADAAVAEAKQKQESQ